MDAPELAPDIASRLADPATRVHFVGVGGSGMSALAVYRLLGGGAASGSDRSFDRGQDGATRSALAAAGVRLHPQDGRGVEGAGVVVASGAVESGVPDLERARTAGVPVLHRSELLAHEIGRSRSVAVAGTCGKSTTTAMIFEVLERTGRAPGLIAGGPLVMLRRQAGLGNARRGSGPLIVEADESDGSLVRYRPEVSVVLNLHRDHREPDTVLETFRTLRGRTRGGCFVSDDPDLAPLRPGARVFGTGRDCGLRAERVRLHGDGSVFEVRGEAVLVPMPGAHNVQNALAALAVCEGLGVPLREAAEALASFRGVARRFERVGFRRGVEVFDDFAHNPTKIRATLEAAQARSGRVRALYQPHGFAPLRFFHEELVEVLADTLRPSDHVHLAPVYYAGGTASRDITSAAVAADARGRGAPVSGLGHRDDWPPAVAGDARPGDLLLVMGARDPTLPDVARAVVEALRA